jgi:hypothetical protein
MSIIDDYKYFFNINGIPIDRTWTLKGIVEQSKEKIPDFIESHISLDDCIENRCKYIKNKYTKVALLWSGGIDSTLIFYALNKYDIDITVLYTNMSVIEYPALAQDIENKKFSNVINSINMSNNEVDLYEYDIVLNGEGADQLIGSDRWLRYTIEQLQDDYRKEIKIDSIEYFDKAVRTVIKKDFISLKEFLWCVNLLFNYDYVQKLTKDISSNLISFYDTYDFNIWSMNNYSNNLSHDNPIFYKYEYKRFIFEINNDKQYFNFKMKAMSMSKLREHLMNKGINKNEI